MAIFYNNTVLISHSNHQIGQKIARLLRDFHFYSEVQQLHHLTKEGFHFKAIITDNVPILEQKLLELGVPSPPLYESQWLDFDDEKSKENLKTFLIEKSEVNPIWLADNIISHHINQIKKTVGSDEVILGLSGGVDSSVVAALIHKAIGQQLTCVFVDTGLLRLDEGKKVMETFAQNMGINIVKVEAESRFLNALAGEPNPEKKRKIIGELFIRIFEEEAAKLPEAKWLAQGTIYPDILESMNTKDGVAIKSHHNVGGLPKEMGLELIEPLKSLFKHEVRELGLHLGLPKAMVYRHPFPGPGLGVRILGEVKKDYADILREADDIFINALYHHNLYDKISQAFAVFIPAKSVGTLNNKRNYAYVIALRAVETIDFMTARAAHLPYDLIEEVSNEIIAKVNGVSRVVYDISNKPPATIEWE